MPVNVGMVDVRDSLNKQWENHRICARLYMFHVKHF